MAKAYRPSFHLRQSHFTDTKSPVDAAGYAPVDCPHHLTITASNELDGLRPGVRPLQ